MTHYTTSSSDCFLFFFIFQSGLYAPDNHVISTELGRIKPHRSKDLKDDELCMNTAASWNSCSLALHTGMNMLQTFTV